MPFQYGNPANPLAHQEGTAQEIIRDLPEVTHFVGGMGTGGTLTGNGRGACTQPRRDDRGGRARARRPRLRPALARRGLHPADLRPERDRSEVPGRLLGVAAHEPRAHLERGIFAGISSGAVVYVAQRIASEIDEGDIVRLLPDGGWKYLSTEAWAEDLATAEKGVAGVAVVVSAHIAGAAGPGA